ncbi:MAG: prenyltransferase [Pseudomonadota bacterium]
MIVILQTLLTSIRLPLLLLAAFCICIAVVYARFLSIEVDTVDIILSVNAAVLAVASVNLLTTYRDSESGRLAMISKLHLSVGKRVPEMPPEHFVFDWFVGWVLLTFSTCIGLYFVLKQGIDLIPFGFLGISLVAFYRPYITRLPLICLIAPGFGFAVVILIGSFIALTGKVTFELILLAFPVFMLTNNLLLLSQYFSVNADKATGQSHMIIRYGLRHGLKAYLYHIIVSVFATMFIVLFFELKTWGAILLLPSLLGVICYFGLRNYINNNVLSRFIPYLRLNVVACLTYPVFLSLSLWFA